jgi:hypothetical protein
MPVKYTKQYLNKLEDLMTETEFSLRYERGNFKSGYCILNTKKVAIVNKYFSYEGKINCLVDIIKSIEIDPEKLSDKNQTIFFDLSQIALKL